MENEKKIAGKILDNLKKKYCAKYGAAIFEIKAKKAKNGLELTGQALIKNQKIDIVKAIKKSGIKIQSEKIRIISDFEEGMEIGWGKVSETLVDILGRYIAEEFLTERATDNFRATQLARGEIVRILAEKGEQALVQPQDLAIGWMKKSQISNFSREEGQKPIGQWKKIPRAEKNKSFEIKSGEKIGSNKFIDNYLEVPYLLGGTTKRGIDCSALTQKMYKEIFGIVLPRHSEDQAKCGVSIKNFADARKYDLVFLKVKKNGHYHIGAITDIAPKKEIISSGDIWVFNARRDKGKAIIQKLDEILKEYELLDIRRIIE